MSDKYDRTLAARQDLTFLVSDLNELSGRLEEVATVARRADAQHYPLLHRRLRDTSAQLVASLEALVEGGTGQQPGLAFTCVAQLHALQSDALTAFTAATGTCDPVAHDPQRAALTGTLQRARSRLWSLISHLADIKEWSLTGLTGPDGPATASITVTFGQPATNSTLDGQAR
jgi:hypothetical protein